MSDAIWPDMIDPDVADWCRADRQFREDKAAFEMGLSRADILVALKMDREDLDMMAGLNLGLLSSDGRRP